MRFFFNPPLDPIGDAVECARAARVHVLRSLESIGLAGTKVVSTQVKISKTLAIISSTDRLLTSLNHEIVFRQVPLQESEPSSECAKIPGPAPARSDG